MICTNKCHNCNNITFITTASINNNSLELTIPNMNICNNTQLCFVITENLPVSETPLPVKVLINGVQFSYINKNGNYVYSDQLTTRKLYIGRFKTDSLLLVNNRCNLGNTSMIISCIPIPAQPAVQKVVIKND